MARKKKDEETPGVEQGNPEQPNEASSQYVDPNDGAPFDATPEGTPEPGVNPNAPKAPLNPVTKSYKADFPARNNGGEQNYAPTADSNSNQDAQQ
jgi:hypothetical protein